ncbi:hypothetical protein Goarm_003577, partial [Gossypium armourianum]|nr:hypothetical protein [Gossypium armourianum]
FALVDKNFSIFKKIRRLQIDNRKDCDFVCSTTKSVKRKKLACEGVSSMEKDMAYLCLNDEEKEVVKFGVEPNLQKLGYDLCLVGCCLTVSMVHFLAMKNTMANLWHILGGIQIMLKKNKYWDDGSRVWVGLVSEGTTKKSDDYTECLAEGG